MKKQTQANSDQGQFIFNGSLLYIIGYIIARISTPGRYGENKGTGNSQQNKGHFYSFKLLMNRHIRHIPALLISVILTMAHAVSSHAAGEQLSEKGKGLQTECRLALDARRYDLQKQAGIKLRRLGEIEHNEKEETLGICAILNAMIMTHDSTDYKSDINLLTERYRHYKSAGEADMTAATAYILGKYNHFILNAYSTSLQYYLAALENHRTAGDDIGRIADLSAIAVINLHLGDNAGWEYAVTAYDEAKRIGHNPSRYITATNLGNFLLNDRKYTEALKYIREAETIAADMHYDMENTYLNTFRASIYENLGKKSLAEQNYRDAIKSSNQLTTNYDILYAKIKYASFLMSEKRFSEADRLLAEVEDSMSKLHLRTFRTQVYPLIAECREALGDFRGALEYQKKSMAEQKELLSEDQQREFALLDLRYKVSEEKRKNAIQSLDLLKRKQYDAIIAAIIFLLLAGCIVSIIYYKKRMASLRAIVSSHLENAESGRRMKEHYEKLLAERNNEKSSGLTDDKASDLFSRLEKLMIDEHIYRQCDLSLEKTAKLLGTNRTYLSQVINEYGDSFTSYVNQFRIKEAIEILSDPDSTDSLKAIGLSVGFASPSNFYTLFRKKVGMAPSVFRENARNISSKKSR